MDIGPEGEPFIAEPVEDPFREPVVEPEPPAPVEAPEPEPAPA